MTAEFQLREITQRLRDLDMPQLAAEYESKPSARADIINRASFQLVANNRTAAARELLKLAA